MEKGINRASAQFKIKDVIQKVFKTGDSINNSKWRKGNQVCIFLSHKNEDKEACLEIGKYLEEAGIDYYLDIYDQELQYASAQNDPIKITQHIKDGVRFSTHMIVVLSEKTIKSQWVPFEIGYGHASLVDDNLEVLKDNELFNLSFLTLIEISEIPIPDFLKIAFPIKGIKSLNEFLEKIKPKGAELTKYFDSKNQLEKIMSWNK
ncbi:toll/interleukin-1 receptor domain-containing protein [Algoriphagus sp. C2-6-M1]|uniref:toll/interleukin-1 receptor domain-containing protein n=1 Tax=Algoriphagus persicinus TaxID=3108754 RepID=UPI002B3EA5C7|nr:toll/interleukin-1 receptor domain-containing protein [Algoriphagus sp. C2-6-M1]MEB2781461.1 toll/interleukin-1 receptor domain-containing protein [Algoriphagus sp. C2-6-M1]